jgi:hypothetical protein
MAHMPDDWMEADYEDSLYSLLLNGSNYSYYDMYTESITSQVELGMRRVVPPFLMTIGVIGNVFVMLVMNRLSSEVFPLCGYLKLVACLDTMLLFVETGKNEWLHQVSRSNIFHGVATHSDATCKLFKFLQNLSIHLNVWILIACSIELLVLLCYPYKIKHMPNIIYTYQKSSKKNYICTIYSFC